VHEPLQDAVLDQHVATGGESLTVDIGRRVGQRVGRIVDEGDARGRDLFAEAVAKQRAPLDDRLTVERRGDDPEQLGGHERVEDDRRPPGLGLGGAEHHAALIVDGKSGIDCVVNGAVGDCTVSGALGAASMSPGSLTSTTNISIGNNSAYYYAFWDRAYLRAPANNRIQLRGNLEETFDCLEMVAPKTTDADPSNTSILGGNSDDQATGANQTGGSLTVAGGIGTLQIVCSDRTVAEQDVVTIYYNNGNTIVLTESTDFDCEGEASEEVCCDNLGAKITATYSAYFTPDCATTAGTCYLTPAADLDSVEDIVIADGGVDGAFGTRVVGATGGVPVNGLLPHKYIADPCSNAGTGVLSEGMMFYNDTKDVYCFCDGAGDDLEVHDNTACF